MHRTSRTVALAALTLGVLTTGASLLRGNPDTQGFTGEVASVMVVTAPVAGDLSLSVTSDADVEFTADPSDPWVVECNDADGGTIEFVADQPFTHTTVASYKRDVQLDLVLNSAEAGSGWAVTTPSDSTDYANGTPVLTATVIAASTAAGNADFDLTVTLKTVNFSTMAAGDYGTTITGTLTAN